MAWKPEVGEEYWFVNPEIGDADCKEFVNDYTDSFNIYFGNCFKDGIEASDAVMQIDIGAGVC